MRISKNTQEKLQNILKIQGFVVRYERGNFAGGYCIVMEQKTIIINKFHPLESKISTLAEIIRQVDIKEEFLTDEQIRMVKSIHSSKND